MKKLEKFLISIPFVVGLTVASWAMFAVYNQTLPGVPATNANNVSVATTYTLAMDQLKGDYVSFQFTAASTTFTSQTFVDGQQSTATIKVSSSPVGGISWGYLYINNTNVPFAWDANGIASNTAVNICNALSQPAFINIATCNVANINSTNPIVYATATVPGQNWTIYTTTPMALQVNGSSLTFSQNFLGGVAPSYSSGTPTISLSGSPSWPVGLPVLYTSATIAITGIVNQTTYYWIPTVAGQGKLATTSTGAVAGASINLTSLSSQTVEHVFTLAPAAYSGTAQGFFQFSNDGVNWAQLTTVSSYTFTPVNPSSTTVIDLGQNNFAWIRFNLNSPPTTGALNLNIVPNVKKMNSD